MNTNKIFYSRKCKVCGNIFNPTTGRQKYCPNCTKAPCCICGGKHKRFFNDKPYCSFHYRMVTSEKNLYLNNVVKDTSKNRFYVQENILYIITSHGETILADAVDYPLLRDKTWYIFNTGYAMCKINGKHVSMHRYLYGLYESDDNINIKHINNNRADNRRCNLSIKRNVDNIYVPPAPPLFLPKKKICPIYDLEDPTKDLRRYPSQ